MERKMPVDNTPIHHTMKFPGGFNSNKKHFPVKKKDSFIPDEDMGKEDMAKERAIAILLAMREYVCNFHAFVEHKERDKNQIYLGIMEIGEELYAYGFHNGKPFEDRKEIVFKGLYANESAGKGVSLQGKGLKHPQAYLTFDKEQQLVIASKHDGGLLVGISQASLTYGELDLISNPKVDSEWEKVLISRLGKDIYEKNNVFYLTKISPFFKSKDCALAYLVPDLVELLGNLSSDLTILFGEKVLAKSATLDKADGHGHREKLYSTDEMKYTFCCKDDMGASTLDESIWKSKIHTVNYNSRQLACDLKVQVEVHPMAGIFPAEVLNDLIHGTPVTRHKHTAALRTWSRATKGSGNRAGHSPGRLRAYLFADCIFDDCGKIPSYLRFKQQPIAFMRDDEGKNLYRALNLPVYTNIRPNLTTVGGQKLIGRKPHLTIYVRILGVENLVDKQTDRACPTNELIGMFQVRPDFLMEHSGNDQRMETLRTDLFLEACLKAGEEITEDHWLFKWCADRFEKPEHNLYNRNFSDCESGQHKELRKLNKFDLANWDHEYELHIQSGRRYLIAMQDRDSGKFISEAVDDQNHSKGCEIVKIDCNFVEWIAEWGEDNKAQIATEVKDPKERKQLRAKVDAEVKSLTFAYQNLVQNFNHENPISVYQLSISPVGYDEGKRVIPFEMIDRDDVGEINKAIGR